MLGLQPAAAEAPGQHVWRIAYVEGGEFSDYQRTLRGVAVGLKQLGFIDKGDVAVPVDTESTEPMWRWLSENAGGQAVFLADAWYSAGWDTEKRVENREALLRRIREKGDIDLILAFGTWAGQDFAHADIDVPVIVASVTNAVESGIIESPERSGRDNVAAMIEPDRFSEQVRLFHSIFPFKKLGIAYEDTPSGRSSVALGEIEAASRRLGIELVRCTDAFDIADARLSAQRLKACHEKFVAAGVNAVYLTATLGMQADPEGVLEPLIAAKIPTFSQAGALDVRKGALLSISESSTEEEGVFTARQVGSVILGAAPGTLVQKYESSVTLAMNLTTVKRIGWNPPLEILVAVDEFFRN
ncbi:ABC transporter substrate binding protein [Sutterella sp.]|uniref:ABC transporter substrate binding protein n=1 Tax=Sutterella sp. TaxID=1981025 RepID=UPI0026E000B8|nr:ABC transporter substrate binding protein [Sutterella sp.]MDO5532996.1 ABC transporter substrate binding protein [Sutterella sp.]